MALSTPALPSGRGRRQIGTHLSEINVTPFIDVMLVLLVIFMITAPLLKQGVKVNLPKAAARPVDTNDRDTLVVTVLRGGRYYLDDREIEPQAP